MILLCFLLISQPPVESPVFQGTAVFHFDEHQITSIPGNEVDLAKATAEILLQESGILFFFK